MPVPKEHPENSPAGQRNKVAAEKADDSGKQVADNIAQETKQGFRGVEVDPTPNENYTLQGVTSGAPTPETDDGAAEDARKALSETATRAAGVSER
jgi:hypothetical protein